MTHAELPKVEDRIGRPLSPYAVTKYVDEIYADVFARCYGTAAIGLRYFNVFGARQDPEGAYAAVIPRWAEAMLDGRPIVIYGDGETTRDFCYIANVVQANLLAAIGRDPQVVGQVYNIAVGGRMSLNELFGHAAWLGAGAAPGRWSFRRPSTRDSGRGTSAIRRPISARRAACWGTNRPTTWAPACAKPCRGTKRGWAGAAPRVEARRCSVWTMSPSRAASAFAGLPSAD